ncbi:PfkB family carbohydrate kinase [Candidatus Thioglobus sp.]|nr:PfkB family carbohydrate kinase [Candidatus Thioglobus sp.]
MKNKIQNLENLQTLSAELRAKGKKVVHCHGVFDLLHVGHIKHFKEAKTFGDILIVSITPDEFVHKGPGRPAFSTSLRLEALSALESVDYVVANKWPTAEEIIKIIQPNFYCKGPDYKNHSEDITGKITNEEIAVKSFGGDIKYTEDITFSSSSLLNKFGNIYSEEQELFIRNIGNRFSFEMIQKKIEEISKLKVLVIGETIIDQYVFCEALGKSGKEPVLVLRDLETQEYLGGSLAIARHLSSFCENVSVLSYLGKDDEYKSFIENNMEGNIALNFFNKSNSPTIVKRRFVDNIDRKKVLGVYSINDELLDENEEDKFIESFDKLSKDHDLVIISDYGHGIITPKIAKHISNSDKFVSLNAQINAANIGTHNIRKYHDVNCLIINESELRHELRQRDGDSEEMAVVLKNMVNSKYIAVTQGKDGAFLINGDKANHRSPGFAAQVIDKIGSGDALLAILSVCLYNNLDEKLSLFIGSLAAGQSVETVGNSVPVSKTKLLKTISHLLK